MTERSIRRWITESVVIVGSILLAFGVDAWWEERQQDADAADLAVALLEDVRASRENFDSIWNSTERRVRVSMEVRGLLRSPTPVVPMDTLNQKLLESIYIDTTAPVLDAYEQLVSRGLLARLHPEVRAALSAWLQRQQDSREYGERDMLDYRQGVMFPFLSGPPVSIEQVVGRYQDLGDWGSPRFEHTWRELHESRELAAILTLSAATARSLLAQYQQLDLRAADLEALLVRHYERPGDA